MKVAGFDIGGANTDLAIIDFDNGEIKNIEVDFAYLPMWSNNDDLSRVLIELIENICPVSEIDAVGISMTAELVDAYDTKKDGVLDVVRKCEDTFDCPIAYVGIDGMMSKQDIETTPLKAAAANWIATAQIATLISDNCIFIDTGSTTTDIITIKIIPTIIRGVRTEFNLTMPSLSEQNMKKEIPAIPNAPRGSGKSNCSLKSAALPEVITKNDEIIKARARFERIFPVFFILTEEKYESKEEAL